MLRNADITIINKYREGTQTAYHTTVIRGCWWYGGTLKNIGDKGFQSAEIFKISIYPDSLLGTNYCEPFFLPYKEWEANTDRDNYWTLKTGDYIVKGVVDTAITKPADFLDAFEDVASIKGYKDLRHSFPQYWKVEGIR